jgi:hypothetical protein
LYQWRGSMVRKGCIYMYVNAKMIPVKTVAGMGRVKENDRGGEFNYETFDIL